MALALVPKTPRRGRRTGIFAPKSRFSTRYPGDPGLFLIVGFTGKRCPAAAGRGFWCRNGGGCCRFLAAGSLRKGGWPGITGTSCEITFTSCARLIGARWNRPSGRGSRPGTFRPWGAGLGPASFTV